MSRPILDQNISLQDFKDFYWLKKELLAFCRIHGISTSGEKIEITSRIIKYLETGVVEKKPVVQQIKSSSRFNWNNEVLTKETLITDSYKNTENVRLFFKNQIGPHFHFSTAFMNWMKKNTGKTLQEAINEWLRLNEKSKDKSVKMEIAPQFEYNRFIRDFIADNPGQIRTTAIYFRKLKRRQQGDKNYSSND